MKKIVVLFVSMLVLATTASAGNDKPIMFADGHFIKTGGPELADELEETGYDAYLPEGSDSESALA